MAPVVLAATGQQALLPSIQGRNGRSLSRVIAIWATWVHEPMQSLRPGIVT